VPKLKKRKTYQQKLIKNKVNKQKFFHKNQFNFKEINNETIFISMPLNINEFLATNLFYAIYD